MGSRGRYYIKTATTIVAAAAEAIRETLGDGVHIELSIKEPFDADPA